MASAISQGSFHQKCRLEPASQHLKEVPRRTAARLKACSVTNHLMASAYANDLTVSTVAVVAMKPHSSHRNDVVQHRTIMLICQRNPPVPPIPGSPPGPEPDPEPQPGSAPDVLPGVNPHPDRPPSIIPPEPEPAPV